MKSEPSRREVVQAGSLGLLGAGAVGSTILSAAGGPSRSAAAVSGAYQNNTYTLPPLPYGYDALEPLYDERTLTIHHTKHHAGYVNGLNATLAKLEAARASGDYGAIKALSRDLAFNGSGHVLHTLFWHSMSPEKPDMPESLRQAMTRSFGSVDAAQKQFAAATKAAFMKMANWPFAAQRLEAARKAMAKA